MISLRKVEKEDAKQVHTLICELENDNNIDFGLFEELYERNIAASGVVYVLAETDGDVVGFGSLHIQNLLHHLGKVAEIQELVVRENQRGRGIGSMIVNYLKQEAIRQGCCLIEVSCNRKREQSHLFYEREGFHKSHFKFTLELEE